VVRVVIVLFMDMFAHTRRKREGRRRRRAPNAAIDDV